MKKLENVSLHITDFSDLRECSNALRRGETIMIEHHTGIVVEVKQCQKHDGLCALVTIKHIGPPTCACKEVLSIFDEREAQKVRWQAYRDAAARLYPSATIRHLVAVQETADKNGAFVEVTVYIPHSEIIVADPE